MLVRTKHHPHTMAHYWTNQRPATTSGGNPATTAAITALPSDLATLRQAATHAIYHFTNLGPDSNSNVPASRGAEKGLRYASAIFDTVLTRGSSPSLSLTR